MKIKLLITLLLVAVLLINGCAGAPDTSSQGVASPRAPQSTSNSASEEYGQSSAGSPPSSATENWDRYVIRNGEIAIVVMDVEVAVEYVKAVAADMRGYVQQSSIRRDGGRVFGTVAIQVPADKFDATMSAVRALAISVDRENTTTEDVTEEFIDNEARLKNLRATEEATQKLLERAGDMEQILAVQRELTNIRGEIEQIEGRQNYLQRRVDMSNITVTLATEAGQAAAATRSDFQPGTTANVAWQTSLNLLSGLAEALLTIVIVLWWIIPLALLAWWLIRRRRRNRLPKAPSQPTPPLDRTADQNTV